MKYSDDPARFMALMEAGQGHIVTAVKQLKQVEFTNQDILSLVQLEIDRHDGTGDFKQEREKKT
jgi:hypothetical protein